MSMYVSVYLVILIAVGDVQCADACWARSEAARAAMESFMAADEIGLWGRGRLEACKVSERCGCFNTEFEDAKSDLSCAMVEE
jgi:hypothetical protein